MRSFLFVLVFCFVSALSALEIETIPNAKGDPASIGVGKITVRITGASETNLRIRVVTDSGKTNYYHLLKRFDSEKWGVPVTGYYINGVRITSSQGTIPASATIVVEKEIVGGEWVAVESKNIRYDPANTGSLWGRIANQGRHWREEQRSIFYFGGPREVPSSVDGILPFLDLPFSPTGRINVGAETMLYLVRQMEQGSLAEEEIARLLVPDEEFTVNKKHLDTKGPTEPIFYQWKTKSDVENIFDEIYRANVNIIKLSWWGNVNDSFPGTNVPDNYDMVYASPTYPETCDFTLRADPDLCTVKKREFAPDLFRQVDTRYVCACCDPAEACPQEDYECVGGGCRKRCVTDIDCGLDQACHAQWHVCYSTYDDCHWTFYYDIGGANKCWGENIFTLGEYSTSGFNAAGRINDVYTQVFKAAHDKGLLVVPVIELDAYHMFKQEFPYRIASLKEKINYLLESYGDYPNWLLLYDKNGFPRKAVYLIEAISNTLLDGDEEYLPIAAYRESFDDIADELNVGFILDPTPLGPSSNYGTYFVPTPQDLQNMGSLLAINAFGHPFDGWMQLYAPNTPGKCEDLDKSCVGTARYYGENYFISAAQDWLVEWKNSDIPMVADVIPGYDDRWRVGSNFLIYGDNSDWRVATAGNAFYYHTAGISLTIWNGFGEGYVFVPYKKRVFEHSDQYVSDINLNLSFLDGLPVYENILVYDNYEYAQYLLGEDRDQDGVDDVLDNCSEVPNPDQSDWNDNAIGDACEDFDGDGVVDANDNCRTTPNPQVFVDENTELIMGVDYTKTGPPYFPVEGGAYFYGFTRTYFSFFPFRWGFKWQPDHNLNGVGDACDPGHAYSFVRNATPVHSNRLYSFTGNFNDYVQIDPRLLANAASKYATIHYCAITNKQAIEEKKWGKDGYCTTAHGSETKYDDTNRPRPYFNFGFSHGTDEMSIDEQGRSPWDMHISWARSIPELKKDFLGDTNYSGNDARPAINISNLFFANNKIYWNWRRDLYEKRECNLEEKKNLPECFNLKYPTGGKQAANNVHYTLSAGVYPELANPVNKNPYITEIEGAKTINYAYFKNQKKYARSSRYSLEKGTLNYYTRQLPKPDTHMADLVLTTCHHCHLVVPESAITAEEEDRWFDYGLWSLVKQEGILVFSAERKFAVEEMRFFVEGAERTLYAVSRAEDGDHLMISYPDSGPDWHRMGSVDNWPTTLQIAAALADGDRFFIMGKANDAQEEHVYVLTAQQTGTAPFGEEEIPLFRFVFEDRGVTGLDNYPGKYLTAAGSARYLLSRDNGVTAIHRFDAATGQFTLLAPAVSPSARKVYNVYGAEDKLYLVGGIDMNDGEPKDLWAFDTATNEWTKLHDNLTGDLRKLVIEPIDGKIVMASPILEFHQTTHSAIALDPADNSISYPTVPVTESPDYLLDLIEGYCLNETDTLLKGGTMISGSCVPFACPWYKSFSIGTTVYSVAGKGDRLYVGTNSTIRVYDISDPNAMILKSTFTTNKRVYDLEPVEGDILYASTSGGLYKFNTANPNTLSQIKFQSTPYNYQYRIQYYNDKLYVGDDNGINIRHKDTFARLAYVNFGSVVDFAIANGELALYWYAFWDEGVQVRDADTLTLKAYEYGYCSTGELTTDHGAFYLACDNYEYRFAGRPDTYIDFWELNGDIREMAENHLYNGWVYIPDGSAVKVSTNNEVPSYCGNGIIEPGEVCDGNSIYCSDLNPSQWNAGTATCNSTCTGWNTGNCYWSGC